MMLQALYQDAGAIVEQVYGNGKPLPLPPPMYTYQPLGYVIELDADGGRAELILLPNGEKKKNQKARVDLLPYIGRTSAVVPILLADKPAYVLGIEDGKSAANPKARADVTRKAFRQLVADCHAATGLAELEAVLRFLDRWNPAVPEFPIPPDLKSNDLLGFRIRGQMQCLHELPKVQAYWAQFTLGKDTRRLRCLVTDIDSDIESKLPMGIKNVPGGQSAGAALSSFNENAFMSYGLDEFSAPISRDAGERFAKALNALLISDKHHTVVGPFDSGVVYAYWSPGGVPVMPLLSDTDDTPVQDMVDDLDEFADEWEDDPATVDPALLGRLLRATHEGTEIHAVFEDSPFHIVGLSSHSGGRVTIRSALTLTLADLFLRQHRWFERLRIVDRNGRHTGRPLSIERLVGAAYRDRKEIPNHLIEALMATALGDAPPPTSLLPAAVRRCQIGTVRTDGKREHVTYARAMLIKFLLTWPNKERAIEMSDLKTDDLTQDEMNAAYRCGRLLSHLERIQYLALKQRNATLVDRYYGGASVTPRTVFPVLMRLANQAHLPAIRRSPGGGPRSHALQNELAEIVAPIGSSFPAYFNIEQQGSFALGYYFQRARTQREIAEAIAAKGDAANTDEAAETSETEEDND